MQDKEMLVYWLMDEGLMAKGRSCPMCAGEMSLTRCEDRSDGLKWECRKQVNEACLTWEDILMENPTDMFALKMAHDSYLYPGYQRQFRDFIARVMPKWKEDMPLYGCLHGMYAFGLIETGFYRQAEKHALKGLELNPRDCWSTHAEAHVIETEGRQDEGIKFLSTTLNDWTMGAMLACQNYWHWALYQIEKGEHQAAVDIYDEEVGKRCLAGAMLDLVDASSLLCRLQMEGVDANDRWRELFHLRESHTDDHILVFNAVHMLMCTLGAKKEDATLNLLMSLRDYVRNGSGTNCEVSREVGLALCEAFEQADKGNFDRAVDILNPLRYDVVDIGASNAQVRVFYCNSLSLISATCGNLSLVFPLTQQDIFNLFLIHAALHSSLKEHHHLASNTWAESSKELIDREKGNERKRSNDRPTHGADPCLTCVVRSGENSLKFIVGCTTPTLSASNYGSMIYV
ncbi:tetratricopeptide repeat protein 38-like [Stylophora pistillata]|uniref:tetratricopeptide repeat protein 38-like n=1 Tax=Stylophora pistillata TaxID=50429 RepID=UPI000C04ACA1|nr:tetratricopeptide repeat protein 38-like [Stylophora pistillata]